ncbi:MAG: 2-hydroxyglutaryl-CoA dehydratase [Chloroflexi bacterium]|nr:2-hydroxyglutaryl-CoA dehydratase [Chloroflexota bacterium]MBU1749973.1 2-hydroxyglutaryl-CoA dehydratase [Chloroflexota bacterium]MBU1877902.1 2-hydroxyglutaryl-CoA dehydratase [Chloroflexota bacterium]
MIVAGVDVGSLTAKALILDDSRRVLGQRVLGTGARAADAAQAALDGALADAGLTPAELGYILATGYGRARVPLAHDQVTEITCHARGIAHLLPDTRTLLDVGGQDSKAIRLGPNGRVADFAMNDKCAAGTGRFLEVMARALEIDVADLGALAAQARDPARISSTCTVFAESEVVGLVGAGRHPADIAAGLHAAIAERLMGLLHQVGVTPPVAMSGGVALNAGVVRAMEAQLGMVVVVPPGPQVVGALGAALIALDRATEGVRR